LDPHNGEIKMRRPSYRGQEVVIDIFTGGEASSRRETGKGVPLPPQTGEVSIYFYFNADIFVGLLLNISTLYK
jgi:hypothetical protein